jgi:catechol 2,3-dioxygenase-like lactoylglutathione lyase family enzyme
MGTPGGTVTPSLNSISAISLFVENLQAAKAFYQTVFGVKVLFEDQNSVAVKFRNVTVNLLRVENARELVEPGIVAERSAGSRFQISIWVDDVDGACARLREHGVALLTGPRNMPWGMRTATFVDPAGHSWEIAQEIVSEPPR